MGPGSSGSGALPPPIPSALPAGLPGSTPWTFTEGDPQDGSLSGNRSNYLQSFSVPAHPSGSSPGDLKESSALEEVTGSASPQQFWVVASGTPPSTPLGPAAVHSEQGGGNPQTLLPPGVQYYYTPSEIPKAGVAGLRESDELANALAGSEPLWTEVNGPGFEVAPDQPMNFLDSFVD